MDEKRLLEAEMAMRPEERGLAAAPSIPYVQYIMEDDFKPENLPPTLRAVVYDKELALSNLTLDEILQIRMGLMRAEIMFKCSRPAMSGSCAEEIMLSALQSKLMVKLARSRGGFERRQQTTQTIIKEAVISGGRPAGGRRWFGLRGQKKVQT